jgi:hypothetical protein
MDSCFSSSPPLPSLSLSVLVVADYTEGPFVTGVLPPSLTAKEASAQYLLISTTIQIFFLATRGLVDSCFVFYLSKGQKQMRSDPSSLAKRKGTITS